jgi:phosphoribosylformimino-5-aminoimidazole carboxamide ribotide isomerase
VLILPAIDLRGGQCIRLQQGDFERETVFGSDPVAIARRWVNQGATFLHLVDLDGARQGRPVNESAIRGIVDGAGVPCQLGGGLRDESDLTRVFDWGIERAVVGTRAVHDLPWLTAICQRFPMRIVLGIDARQGKVATDGWLRASDVTVGELARRCSELPLAALVYTDISRDGMLSGPDLCTLAELADTTTIPVFASGGISTLEDVRQLLQLELAGCIIGRALYEGQLKLPTIIKMADNGTRAVLREQREQATPPDALIPDP